MKKINYLITALILMFAISFEVKAATDLECITGDTKQNCVLNNDIEASGMIIVKSEIELDLNGHTIRPAEGVEIKGGLIGVMRGGKLTIKDSVGTGKITSGNSKDVYAAVQVTIPEESTSGKAATLIVESGTLEGYYYAVSGNGKRHNTNITINGGTLEALSGTGIYHPQDGTLTINGGTITGKTGIEMRSGALKVNGGTITGTAVPVNVTPNGNGTTTDGAGIAIAQHTTLKDINVKITNGTIKGYSAVYESNPQKNTNVKNQVNISINGGTFEAINEGESVIYSEDIEDFVVRGTFNKALDSKYISDTAPVKQSDGNYIIGTENYTEIGSGENYGIDTIYESESYEAPIETFDVNLSWNDLHWVFVYEGEAASPAREVWLTVDEYNKISANMEQPDTNEINGSILDSKGSLEDPTVEILVENNSVFAVDVTALIEPKNAIENYTNSAELKVANKVNETVGDYGTQANASNIATKANTQFLVKPTATRFVNDSGATVNVTGEVKLTFTKSN